MPLVDTHVHLNFETFAGDLDELTQAWRQAGVSALVHSCVEPGDFLAMQRIADRIPELFLAVGLHPLDMDKWSIATADQIAQLAASDGRVVAIGETGLDFYKADNEAIQREAFWQQLTIAHRQGLPVIVHCRDAASATAEVIREFQLTIGPVTGVMHCWAGTPDETQMFLDLGFYVSFSGIVTFKNAHQVKASAQMVPSDRLLVETDCPFLTPEPHRKERRNQPAFVYHVATHLAELRQVEFEALAQTTTHNAVTLFNLPKSLVFPSADADTFCLPTPAGG
ncbi:TatD family hydrolase [Phormidium tenue]|uniref:D-aminoacyl-tRNA deacylase n=1 Tax=Phormidium tenue NIES-30 TaxID=549789 RepID=A0A1U7J7G2_9CYAN|nr:TatD family hydrolase [Phormidium tenue]MBD2231618.1 TatD family hydrolase [Phormidium tenue FACHB-1052]OKH49006.1 deoxyribonuclease [Phormidium tenue NIES-30]